ncbi:hypothetical protein A5N17_13925 [Arthrobacter sp. D2]|nr:hypothetical protein [Arthrobacter sp. M5]NKR15169.1 hypothetical protein [Arthrobacter sp. M6]OEH61600.1 hypothetical protein A5N17_13925 [Arthrobacter sp. D2]OEH61659.1 hypothetical protein A5N13_16345 [Arthrobacter sp. D4]
MHGESYFLRAFPVHMWTTGPTEPAAHNHHVTNRPHLDLGERWPCTASVHRGQEEPEQFPMVQA